MDERSKYLRRLVVRALQGGNRGHVGSSLSLIEIMRALYDDVMQYDPKNPAWPERDRLILSKGHGCLAQYALLADKGFFPLDTLDTFCRRDSILGGHPDARKIPGVEFSTGALGHGLSVGIGMALALRNRGSSAHVFVVVGDGEINEGSVWEAAMCAGKHRLENLTVVVDYNHIQSAGFVKDVQPLEPLSDKWRTFGFFVREADGHDIGALSTLLNASIGSAPNAVICRTIKGKGFPFAENEATWHHRNEFAPEIIAQMYDCLK